VTTDGITSTSLEVLESENMGLDPVQASNKASKAETEGAMKIVQSKPIFANGGLEPSYEFKEGLDDLVLIVDIDGSPLPVVTWLKDGKSVDPDMDPRVSITTGIVQSCLRVTNIGPKDKGTYSVSLKNPNGTAESSSNVLVKRESKSQDLFIVVFVL